MGRPIPRGFIGDVSINGNQLRVVGVLDSAVGVEELYIKEQINPQKFTCVSVSNETREGQILLQQADPQTVGEGRIAVSPFGGTGGAEASATMKLENAIIEDEGTGYTVGDLLTLDGGSNTTSAVVEVTSVDTGGEILSLTVNDTGAGYTSLPIQPITLSGGTGTGSTITATWEIDTITVDSAGSGYTEAPLITFASDTGSGAEASATISGGSVSGIIVDSSGDNYLEIPSVAIESPSQESARTIQTHLVKTFEGSIYEFEIDEAANEAGESDLDVR